MHPLETYNLNQAPRGLHSAPGNGLIYSAPLYLQRGHGICNFLGTLFRLVRPLVWPYRWEDHHRYSEKKSPEVSTEDIILKLVGYSVTESTRHQIRNCGAGVLKARDVLLRRIHSEAKT